MILITFRFNFEIASSLKSLDVSYSVIKQRSLIASLYLEGAHGADCVCIVYRFIVTLT